MKRWLALAVVFLTMSVSAHADEASKRAKVEQLFVAMHLERTVSEMVTAIRSQMMQSMQSMQATEQMTAEQKKVLDNYQMQLNKLIDEATSWKAIEPAYVDLYAQVYTESEIDDMLSFFQSPGGRAMIAKTPELMTKSLAISQHMMIDLEPKLTALMQQLRQQMNDLDHAAPAPATMKN